MRRFAPFLACLPLAALFALVGWTSTSSSEWFKGIIYAGSGKIQLTDATGNLVPAGNLTSGGNVSIAGTLAVTGATTLRSTLAVTGAQTNAGALNVVGALGVTGAASLRSTLNVSGATVLGGALIAQSTALFGGAVTNASTLEVVGETTFSSATIKTTSVGTYTCTGTVQGTATAITTYAAGISGVTGVDGCALPTAATGRMAVVGNTNASLAARLWPASGDRINNGSVDASFSVAAGKTYQCTALDSTRWLCAGN